jgi:hypothetical protein
MPLPFNNKHDGRRQYQCFCCGIITGPSTVDFKEHIFSTHEEGRDYIKCPLERCSMPVRDVRAHYRAAHPQEKIPNNCQLRALVWKDPKDPQRRSKKPQFKEGYHISPKCRKKLHYRSGWELEVYKVLDEMNSVATYEAESLSVDYWYDGKQHTYLPDLKIYFDDGRKEVWEIKPERQTDLAVNEAKWDYCRAFCERRGWKFQVVTETVIGKLKNDLRLEKREDA